MLSRPALRLAPLSAQTVVLFVWRSLLEDPATPVAPEKGGGLCIQWPTNTKQCNTHRGKYVEEGGLQSWSVVLSLLLELKNSGVFGLMGKNDEQRSMESIKLLLHCSLVKSF